MPARRSALLYPKPPSVRCSYVVLHLRSSAGCSTTPLDDYALALQGLSPALRFYVRLAAGARSRVRTTESPAVQLRFSSDRAERRHVQRPVRCAQTRCRGETSPGGRWYVLRALQEANQGLGPHEEAIEEHQGSSSRANVRDAQRGVGEGRAGGQRQPARRQAGPAGDHRPAAAAGGRARAVEPAQRTFSASTPRTQYHTWIQLGTVMALLALGWAVARDIGRAVGTDVLPPDGSRRRPARSAS